MWLVHNDQICRLRLGFRERASFAPSVSYVQTHRFFSFYMDLCRYNALMWFVKELITCASQQIGLATTLIEVEELTSVSFWCHITPLVCEFDLSCPRSCERSGTWF